MENKLHITKKIQNLCGCADSIARFLEKEQLMDRVLWRRFVNQFREQIDGKNLGWRGEYWGKMMRGGVMVYEYTRTEELYDVLTETVCDMLTVANDNGRVSSYSEETEFNAWDMWCRKYVMLGLLYFYDICRDPALKEQIVKFLCQSTDYIMAHIGNEEGKIKITSSSSSWLGINSSSILEPIVRLYNVTGEKRYLEFAGYIVEEGAAEGINIFELAYENKLYPYQYGVPKAYEMISCFEGLVEYYCATGNEKYKTAAVNFAKAVIESDVTIIGSCGCTHELFDHSKVRQTAKYDGVMQETCVTVTWMKFCARLLVLTGESIFADCIEKAFYNAYAGAVNTEHKQCDYIYDKFIRREKNPYFVDTFLPFDSYSPLTAGKRGVKVGGAQILSDMSYYGCCTCISPAGVGLFAKHSVLVDEDGLVLEFFEKGEQIISYKGKEIKILTDTLYPAEGKLAISVEMNESCQMTLKIRVPGWSKETLVKSEIPYVMNDSYIIISGEWAEKTELEVAFDMTVRASYPISWEKDVIYVDMSDNKPGAYMASAVNVRHTEDDDYYISLSYGPIVLCADSRMGKPADSVFAFQQEGDSFFYEISDRKEIIDGCHCLIRVEFLSPEGEKIYLTDYSSAGKDWETMIAAWMRTN
ncbi:MAG: glycoside hydrolase family 127 protein [Lachnospiraceae bacterium]|nr:glycoside hydrolase family 127 protein [Lachnospiraceae bacterium]